jgi:hypothetical protein
MDGFIVNVAYYHVSNLLYTSLAGRRRYPPPTDKSRSMTTDTTYEHGPILLGGTGPRIKRCWLLVLFLMRLILISPGYRRLS